MRRFIAAASFVAAGALAGPALAAEPLVDADWLKAHLDDETVAVLDIREDGAAFAESHIPGAVHSNYGEAGWRTTIDGIPGMLPEPAALEELIGGLGIDNDDHVVVVPEGLTSSDFSAATRVYWTFKVLGHDEVSVLNGGWAGWSADAANPVEAGAAAAEPATFAAEFRPELVATAEEVEQALAAGDALLIDGRPVEQFRGEAKHDAARVAGTLPGAVNLDNRRLVENGGYFIEDGKLDAILAELGIGKEGEQIAFCNTGHWASIAWFAASEMAGNEDVKLYDGSMVEWTADPARPVANTPAQ